MHGVSNIKDNSNTKLYDNLKQGIELAKINFKKNNIDIKYLKLLDKINEI